MKRLVIIIAVTVPMLLAGAVAAAQGGESATGATQAAPSKLTLCHKTSSSGDWRRITVSTRAMTKPNTKSGKLVRAHLRHTGDVVVVGDAACPTTLQTPAPTSTPATKITICHKTGSASTPYRRITVSSRAVSNPNSPAGKLLRGHAGHTGDLLMPGVTLCPSATQGQGSKLTANLQPVQGATGSGVATFSVRLGGGTLCHKLVVAGLTDVNAAHIHRRSTGAVVVPLTTPVTGTSSGCGTVDRALLRELTRNPGAFYVNVHTSTYPNGQIQGSLTK